MYIVDTGPVLKFFATNTERWFFGALAGQPIHAPQAVCVEVFDVPRRRPQFSSAPDVWRKVAPKLIVELPDDPTPALEQAARDVLRQDLEAVQRVRQDLGEKMALLHASVEAQVGREVVLCCDDGPAQQLIAREAARLRRLSVPGSIQVVDSIQILRWAIEAGAIKDKAILRQRYDRMAGLDESLPKNIRSTPLLDSPPWPSR